MEQNTSTCYKNCQWRMPDWCLCLLWKIYRITFYLKLFFATGTERKDKAVNRQAVVNYATINRKAECLLKDYGNSILRLAYTYLHNMSDAEDILQDTMIQYLKTQPVLESTNHEKAWLLRVAANLSKNKIDYNKIRKMDEIDETLAEKEREDLSFVWEAVKELPEKYREVIHLFHYEGYSTADIADIVGRKESTVRSDLRRGRMQLKAILKEAFEFDEI